MLRLNGYMKLIEMLQRRLASPWAFGEWLAAALIIGGLVTASLAFISLQQKGLEIVALTLTLFSVWAFSLKAFFDIAHRGLQEHVPEREFLSLNPAQSRSPLRIEPLESYKYRDLAQSILVDWEASTYQPASWPLEDRLGLSEIKSKRYVLEENGRMSLGWHLDQIFEVSYQGEGRMLIITSLESQGGLSTHRTSNKTGFLFEENFCKGLYEGVDVLLNVPIDSEQSIKNLGYVWESLTENYSLVLLAFFEDEFRRADYLPISITKSSDRTESKSADLS